MDGLQPRVIPVLGDLTPSFGFCGHCTHTTHTYMWAKTIIHIKRLNKLEQTDKKSGKRWVRVKCINVQKVSAITDHWGKLAPVSPGISRWRAEDGSVFNRHVQPVNG